MERRIVRLVCTWTIVLAGMLTGAVSVEAQTVALDEKAAREAFERGRVYYDGGEFDQAAAAFEDAYRLSGRDALLYNLYLSYRDANQQQQAADALRNYLAKVANIENRSQLEARLNALDQGLERERREREAQANAEAKPQVAAATPVPAPVATVESGRSKKFWAGVGLASAGGAMMLASIATGVMASGKQSDLDDKCPDHVCADASLKSTADSGKTLAHTTDALLFGGLAVAAAGAVLVVLDLRASREQKPLALDGDCSRSGCMARATVRF
ncbi:MAG TPA: hypothetical protein VI299_02230 [Polyangiales bacterium]